MAKSVRVRSLQSASMIGVHRRSMTTTLSAILVPRLEKASTDNGFDQMLERYLQTFDNARRSGTTL